MVPNHRNVSLDLLTAEIEGVIYVEEFRPVVGFEGYYEISSFGRIKKLRRPYKTRKEWRRDRIVLAGSGKKKKYLKVHLTADGRKKSISVHRLVALHFLPLIPGKDHVNHKTGIKTDNHYTQLEWCTPQENNEHGYQIGLLKRGRKPYTSYYVKKGRPAGIKKIINIETGEIIDHVVALSQKTGYSIKNLRRSLSGERYNRTPYRYLGEENLYKAPPPLKVPVLEPVAKLTMDGIEVQRYRDVKDIEESKTRGKVRAFLNCKISHVDGYIFKRLDSNGNLIDAPIYVRKSIKYVKKENPKSFKKKVNQYDLSGNFVATHESVSAASKAVGGKDSGNLRKHLRGIKGKTFKSFIWKYL